MSSYLNIYLVPKENKTSPLLLYSYSRSSLIYHYFNDNAYINNEEKAFTAEDFLKIVNSCKRDIESYKNDYYSRYKIIKGSLTPELVESLVEIEEKYQSLEKVLAELVVWYDLAYEISLGYTDFAEILINID